MDSPTLRRKVGLTFLSNYKQWAGGVIYILNIVNALKLLRDEEKPELFIYYHADSPVDDLRAIGYPYIRFYEVDTTPGFLKKCMNYASVRVLGKPILTGQLADVIYPDFHLLTYGKKPLHWIPDFQHYYLPQMSSEQEVSAHKKYHHSIAHKEGVIVFSSEDSMNDFKKFYPAHKCELRLLRFASTVPDQYQVQPEEVIQKYGLTTPYFMAPNQFWKHKNHKVVLQAIALLKNKTGNFKVVFTGSQNDHRNKDYFSGLKEFIQTQQIEPYIQFLGFIDRREQLSLMDNALAIIQPSLFEGWSTVVEDAKAINQCILLSDLPVHREQANENCHFFDPHTASQLAQLMQKCLQSTPARHYADYTNNVRAFAQDFMKAITL